MITINRSGKFDIPQDEKYIGYNTEIQTDSKKFYIDGLMDISLVYKMILRFNDGSFNYFLLDSNVVSGGTVVEWIINNGTSYLPGVAEIEITGSNGSGVVFRSENMKIFIDTSINFITPAISSTYEETA